MTDLVRKLRRAAESRWHPGISQASIEWAAADLIEAYAAEIECLRQQVESMRRLALEEAAQVADEDARDYQHDASRSGVAADIANHIRALATKEDGR